MASSLSLSDCLQRLIFIRTANHWFAPSSRNLGRICLLTASVPTQLVAVEQTVFRSGLGIDIARRMTGLKPLPLVRGAGRKMAGHRDETIVRNCVGTWLVTSLFTEDLVFLGFKLSNISHGFYADGKKKLCTRNGAAMFTILNQTLQFWWQHLLIT